MKGKQLLGSGVAAALVLVLMAGLALAQAPEGTPLGTAFTYQGQLKSNDVPYTGACDIKFALYDALTGGTQVGILTKTNVAVDEGFFTVQLDYGAGKFTGDARWLEMSVRCPAGSGTYTLLSPRQALTAAPAALSLALPFSAQGVSSSALVSVANGGTGPAAQFVSWFNDGLLVGYAGDDGVHMERAEDDGVFVGNAGGDGLSVGYAGGSGVYVAYTDGSGVYVDDAVANGVYVGFAYDGVHVNDAWDDGVYANTGDVDHEWGFYTPDRIYAGYGLASGGPSMIVAQNGDRAPLEAGDVVVVSGVGTPFAGSDFPAPQVRRAGAGGAAVAGVVYARFVAEEQVEEVERDGQVEQRTSLHSRSTEGPVAPGEYLLLVVLGAAQVRASTEAGGIAAGDLLAVAGEGQAAPMGAAGYVPGSLVGTAMEALEAAEGSGLIWVLVNPR
jgi:hypothetical protein